MAIEGSSSTVSALIGLIGVAVGLLVKPISEYFSSKTREHETNWRSLRIEFYKEFVLSLAALEHADATAEERLRFNRASNSLPLVASTRVLNAMIGLREELTTPVNKRRPGVEDEIRKKLIWEMRKDIGYLPAKARYEDFSAPFWTSGLKRDDSNQRPPTR